LVSKVVMSAGLAVAATAAVDVAYLAAVRRVHGRRG
jgi:hypothetical protein